jgi:hypothetical protein
LLLDEVRTGKIVKVGNGSQNFFAEVARGFEQKGSALEIYPTTNRSQFVRYFYDGTTQQLKRITNGAERASIVAHSITNQFVFSAEDFRGGVLTNNENNRVIGLTLQFYQMQYPQVQIGPGSFYDFYQLRTKITRRALE